jgi:TPR repeat protein
LPKDLSEATGWVGKAADQGYAPAQALLGALYENGMGMAKDSSEAARWYRKAAEQGNAAGQVDLGSLLEAKAEGSTQDLSEAAGWYRKAADQGDALAQYRLGLMDSLGHGVPQNKVSAYMWMSLATGRVNKGTQDELAARVAELAVKMTPQEIAEAQRWRGSGNLRVSEI